MAFTPRAQGRIVGPVTRNPERDAALERYVEARRARPQIRPAPSAGLAVNRVMKPLGGSRKARGSSALALAAIWPEIMGPRWSRISAPVRFRGSKDGRTLVITAPGQVSALMTAASGQILERINAHYGHDYVQALQFVQERRPAPVQEPVKRGLTPSEEARLQDGLGKLRNPRLREALEKLGREVMRKEP